jgi:spore coat polysaccharide biosynthesis predicted glycosyltransferase SpsG
MAALPRYPVALVLNQNAHAERSAYPAGDGTAYLLGLPYTMLRREFGVPRPPRPVATRARRILATFGGADPAGMTARTLRAIATLPGSVRDSIEVIAVVGAAAPGSADLATIVATTGIGVTVERDVTDMVERLAWADLTVTSGGSTVWELARIGGPALVVETSPAEVLLARGLERVGLFDRLGPAIGLDDAAIGSAIARRLDDVAWRTRMASLGPSLVDGQGAARVVAAVAGLDAR